MALLPVIMEITCILNTRQILRAFSADESTAFSEVASSFSVCPRVSHSICLICSEQSSVTRKPSNHESFSSASAYLFLMTRKYGVSIQKYIVLNAQAAIAAFTRTVLSQLKYVAKMVSAEMPPVKTIVRMLPITTRALGEQFSVMYMDERTSNTPCTQPKAKRIQLSK